MRHLLFSLLLASTLAAAAPPPTEVTLGPMSKQALDLPKDPAGRHRNGVVRALPKAAPFGAWSKEQGGYVTRLRATSQGAAGIRVRLDLGTLPGEIELRAQGTGGVETMTIDPVLGPTAWTPWTDGQTQSIEVFSRVQPSEGALTVGAIVHMTESAFPKAASSCTLSTACPTGNSVLDAAIEERKKSLLRISFVDGGSAFLCSATLVDTPQRPTPYVITANHCIGNEAAASTITSYFFFELATCGGTDLNPLARQVAGGMQMVFPNYNVDMTMLRMNNSPPDGVTFAPMNPVRLRDGEAVVNLSHPRGDNARYTTGNVVGETRNFDLPYDMYWVSMNKGLIEPGSSGSALYTLTNGVLELRGVTSAAAEDLSCTNSTGATIFGRLEVMYPQMAPFIGLANPGPDDLPNRVKDWTGVPNSGTGNDLPLNVIPGGMIDFGTHTIAYPGDVDIFRFILSGKRVVTLQTSGTTDTVASLLDAAGEAIAASDDAQAGDTNAGLTHSIPNGTYYIHVAHWDPAAIGSYGLTVKMEDVGPDNYTSLWWNANESGWGVNVNHQGNILFATLFTYDTDGTPMWLVMSNGARQFDGTFTGPLYRATGPVFNAQPWTAVNLTQVGTMTFAFVSKSQGTMTYTVNGVQVSKQITPQAFGALPDCDWSDFDRTYANNLQDLWWTDTEPGWGINLAHQDNTLFATLFTYGADGKARWFVMSEGKLASGAFSGTLYRTAGPAFNTVPWTATTVTAVGTMSVRPTNGNAAMLQYTIDGVTVSKAIKRQVFSTPKVQCE